MNKDATEVERANYRSFIASYDRLRENLKLALDADESRIDCADASATRRRVILLYNRAIREMHNALSIKLSSIPTAKKQEVMIAKEKIERFLIDSMERVQKLESETGQTFSTRPSTSTNNLSVSVSLPATVTTSTRSCQRLAPARSRDKTAFLRNVNPKYGDEILSTIVEQTDVKLSDVQGNESAKKALEENVILPALNPKLFTGLLSPCKGILLFGPPGNGKTFIAKAVANECGSVFFNISAANIMSKWVGDGERLVQALFQVAKNAQPSIIFIDEIDSMLCERSENEQGATRRIKTEFLIQLDGVSNSDTDRILVLGATNRPQELDEGILRRFPQRIFIDLPDSYSRAQMIKRTFLSYETPIKLTERDIEQVAKLTENYSYSDLVALCRAAALIPVSELNKTDLHKVCKKNLRPVTYLDLERSLQSVRPSMKSENRKLLLEFAKKYAQI